MTTRPARRARLRLCLFLAGLLCGPAATIAATPAVEPDRAAAYAAAFSTAALTPEVQRKWARSCALCHVRGEGGAPRMGDSAAWQPRLAQGDAVLMVNTLEGLERMPPLGYCMDCELGDFAAMIQLMVGRR
ncbi:MAG: cytochrome c5 family protein [Gammaproteobacteria bacterium]|nr:MAG: cytochrome c5 family protein [Gammaproteobacteria bacterium]